MKKIKLKDGSIVHLYELDGYKNCIDNRTGEMVLMTLFQIMLNKRMLSAINIEELLGMELGQIEIVDDIEEPDPIRKNKEKIK